MGLLHAKGHCLPVLGFSRLADGPLTASNTVINGLVFRDPFSLSASIFLQQVYQLCLEVSWLSCFGLFDLAWNHVAYSFLLEPVAWQTGNWTFDKFWNLDNKFIDKKGLQIQLECLGKYTCILHI